MQNNRLQSLLISYLTKHGHVELLLPDGVTLEIGILQEGVNGELLKKDDYCWVMASHRGRTASIDPYNLGLSFKDEKNTIVFEDKYIDDDGREITRLEVI